MHFLTDVLHVFVSIVFLISVIILFVHSKRANDTAGKALTMSQKMIKLHLLDNVEIHKLTVERVALLRLFAEAKGLNSLADAEIEMDKLIRATERGNQYYSETIDMINDLREEVKDNITGYEDK